MTSQKAMQCIISGIVQGVGFRVYTQREAIRLNLTGWVKNTPEGHVEVFAQGDERGLILLKEWLKKGPSAATVTSVLCKTAEFDKHFTHFKIMR